MSVKSETFNVSILKFPIQDFELFLNITKEYQNGPGINREANFAVPLKKLYDQNERGLYNLKQQKIHLASRLQRALYMYSVSKEKQKNLYLREVKTLLGPYKNSEAVYFCKGYRTSQHDEILLEAIRMLWQVIDDESKKELSEYEPLFPRGKSVQTHIHDVALRNNLTDKFRWVAAQGCGSLSMNPGLVAYSDYLLPFHEVYLSKEANSSKWNEIAWRKSRKLGFSYPCIFKLKKQLDHPLRIGTMDWAIEDKSRLALLRAKDFEGNIFKPDKIEFAVSGHLLLKCNNTCQIESHNFADLRHRFLFPQLESEKKYYFGHEKLLKNSFLRREVDKGNPITFTEDLSKLQNALGKSEITIDVVKKQAIELMEALGYFLCKDPSQPGEFQLDSEDNILICKVVLLESFYPCTVIGLDKNNETLYLIASTGKPSLFGITATGITELLRRSGLYNALLIDHGYDVFQWYMGQFRVPMGMGREKIRAAFIVGAKRGENGRFADEIFQNLDIKERVM